MHEKIQKGFPARGRRQRPRSEGGNSILLNLLFLFCSHCDDITQPESYFTVPLQFSLLFFHFSSLIRCYGFYHFFKTMSAALSPSFLSLHLFTTYLVPATTLIFLTQNTTYCWFLVEDSFLKRALEYKIFLLLTNI